jgi:hypothetical protein
VPISSKPTGKPHRRVLLTQPSAVVDATAQEAMSGGVAGEPGAGAGANDSSRPVRVVAYLTNDEAQQLDGVWLQMRTLGIRPSKADIVRAALTLAMDNTEALGVRLTAQLSGK